jgi:SAM-dependent methyltransferase
MINDTWRNEYFYRALQKHAKDKIILDVGTGTGILSFYALSLGAKFAYCVEISPAVADMAQKVLEKHFDSSRFKIICANFWTNAMDQHIDQKADILVSETLGPGLFDIGMIHTWHSAKKFLTDNAISLPGRVHIDVWTWSKDKKVSNTSRGPIREFNPSAVINKNYAQALLDLNQEYYNNAYPSGWIRMGWKDIKSIPFCPDRCVTDVVSYTMDQLPNLILSDSPSPRHIVPKISFDLDFDAPCTMAIMNKMSIDDDTVFLKDSKFMPWDHAPAFEIPAAGTYTFTYDNPDLIVMAGAKEWICTPKLKDQ